MACGVHLGYFFLVSVVNMCYVSVAFFSDLDDFVSYAGSCWFVCFKQSMHAVYGLQKVSRTQMHHHHLSLSTVI